MATDVRTALLEAVAESKQLEIPTKVEEKKQQLNARNPSKDPYDYDSLAEYTAANGPADSRIVSHFLTRNTTDSFDEHNRLRAEQKVREAYAFADDAELQSVTGQIKDNIGSLAVGTQRLVSHIATLPSGLLAAQALGTLDDRAIDIYERERAGQQLSDEDRAYLEEPFQEAPQGGTPFASRRKQLEAAYMHQGVAEAISEEFRRGPATQLANPENRRDLHEGFSDAYDANKHYLTQAGEAYEKGEYAEATVNAMTGVAALVWDGALNLADNPAGVMAYVTENAPQLAIGGVSKAVLAATNMGYATDIYVQAVDEYQETHGRLPNKAEAAHMLGWSLSAGALEQVADASILRTFSKVPGGTKNTSQVLNSLLESGVIKGVAKVANNAVTRTAGKATLGAAGEGATETYQTAVEDTFSRLKLDFDGKNLYTAGMIGFGIGGTFAGTGRVVTEFSDFRQAIAEQEAKDAEKVRARVEAQNAIAVEAAETGDVSQLLNPENEELYNPVTAARALGQHADLHPENVDAVVTQIDGLIADKQKDLRPIQVELLQKLDQLDAAETNTQRKALNKEVQDIQLRMQAEQAIIAEMTGYRESAVARPNDAEIDQSITDAQTKGNTQAQEDITVLLMQDPLGFDEDQVSRLASNTANFTPEQAEFIRNFSEAQAATNALQTLSGVTSQILTGRDGFKGVEQYKADVAEALRRGDLDRANQELNALREFARDHLNKGQAFAEARKRSEDTGKPQWAYRDPRTASGWVITDQKPQWWSEQTRRLNGGFQFNASDRGKQAAQEIVDRVALENVALAKAGVSLRGAIELSQSTAQEEATVQDTIPEEYEDYENSTPDPQGEAQVQDEGEAVVVEPEAEPAEETQPVEEPQPETVDATEAAAQFEEDTTVQETTTEPENNPEAEREIEVAPGRVPQLTGETVKGNLETDQFYSPEMNFIAAYFTQRADVPLGEIADFLNLVYQDGEADIDLIGRYHEDDITPEMMEYFALLKEAVQTWEEQIKTNINESEDLTRKDGRSFKYEDYMQDFKGNVPENVVTAIALSAVLWLTENGGGRGINPISVIKSMLGLTEDAELTSEEINRFARVGERRDFVIQDMGKKVVSALGLRARRDAPIDEQQKLELAMGAHVLAVLQQSGLVVESREAISEDVEESVYIRALRDADDVPHPLIQQFVDTAKAGDRFLNKVFEVESEIRPPAQTEGEFSQERTKTGTLVPETIKKISKKVSKRAHFIREDMKQIRNALSRRGRLLMAGLEETPEGYVRHKAVQDAMDARNEALIRELDFLEEFEEAQGDQPFYIVPAIWKHHRVGQVSNEINTQTGKIQRHNVTMRKWRKKVVKGANNQREELFKYAVAQGLGISTDKLTREKVFEALEQELQQDDIQSALEVLQRIARGESISPAEEAALVAAVKDREKYHTLDALENWRKYEEGQPFLTEMLYEVDGVTNGPALSLTFMGMNNGWFAPKFGMFGKDRTVNSHAEYLAQGHLDLYQEVVNRSLHHLKTLPNMARYFERMGNLLVIDRNELKTPIQAMFFGSGLKKAISSMKGGIVDRFYAELEDAYNNPTLTNEQRTAQVTTAVNNINTLLPGNPVILPENPAEVMTVTELTPRQVDLLGQTFADTVGQTIEESIKELFSDFISTRQVLNQAVQAAWARYDIAYKLLYDREVQRRQEDGRFPVDKKGNLVQALDAQTIADIEEVLRPLEPLLHSPMSKQDGNLAAGIRADKPDYVPVVPGTATHSQKVRFGAPVNGSKSITVRGNMRGTQNPGVAPFIDLIHSSDSAISMRTIDTMRSLNIHDAHGFSVGDIQVGANEFNKQAYQVLYEFSVPMEMVDTLQRSVDAEADFIEQFPELGYLWDTINVGTDQSPVFANEDFLAHARDVAVRAEAQKLNFLAQVELFDQYSFQGGGYNPTAEDKAAIEERLAALASRVDPNSRLGQQLTARAPVTSEGEIISERSEESDLPPEVGAPRNKPEDTAWGITGEPQVTPDLEVAELLDKYSDSKSLIQGLASIVSRKPKTTETEFQIGMLRLLYKTAQNLDVVVVSPLTEGPAAVQEKLRSGAYAATAIQNGKVTLYIKGADFVHSGLNTQVLVHELVHAATHAVLAQYQTDPSKLSADARQAVESLIDLRTRVEGHLRQNNLLDEWAPAVSSVDELVAWGMSDYGFQQVMAGIQVDTTTDTEATTRSGLRQFIDALVAIFFGAKAEEAISNAFGSMIFNVGTVMGAARVQQNREDVTVLTMAAPDFRGFTTDQVFDALASQPDRGALAESDVSHLRDILMDVVKAAYGRSGAIRASALATTPSKPEDVFLEALRTGQAPFASKLAAELNLHDQEAFVLESVEITLREALGARNGSIHRRELKRLYNRAKAQIRPQDFYEGDWSQATPVEMVKAQHIWNLIFRLEANENQGSDFLSQFGAAALVYKPLRNQLHSIRINTVPEGNLRELSLGAQIKEVGKRAMDALARRLTGTRVNQRADAGLMQLVTELARVENRNIDRLRRREESPNTWVERQTRRGSEAIRRGIERAAGSQRLRESQSKLLRRSAAIIRTVAGDRVEAVTDRIDALVDQATKGRYGPLREIMNEVRVGRPEHAQVDDLLVVANTHEQTRKHIKEDVVQFVKGAFGGELTKRRWEALSRVLLKTDLAVFDGKKSLADLYQLVTDNAALETEITSLVTQLSGPHRKYYLAQAKALGLFMATGKVASVNLMLNAHNIAFLANTPGKGSVTQADGEAAMEIIDQLASLYALKYSRAVDRSLVGRIMNDESARVDDNGVDFVLKLANEFKRRSKKELFEDKDTLMMKGYIKDIFNPHISVVAAPDAQSNEMKAAGYVQVGAQTLGQDPHFQDQTRRLWKIRDKGIRPTVLGIMQNTGRMKRGSPVVGDAFDAATGEINHGNVRRMFHIQAQKAQAISGMFNIPENWDPLTDPNQDYLVPVINRYGDAASYRYMMEEYTKDEVLERDLRADQVLGTLASSIYDKASSFEISNSAIDALKVEADQNRLADPDAYIDFNPMSDDPIVRERWRLLPKETKAYIRSVWGRNGMYVRKDQYNIVMGFRKFSLADAFDKKLIDRNMLQQILLPALETMFGKKAALRVLQAETGWQEIVKMVKDNYVIKSLFTLIGNESSNFWLLWLRGVPVADILKGKAIAWSATMEYQENRRLKNKLELEIDGGYLTGSALDNARQRVLELEEDIQRNPMKDVIDAGMFQTLVEDIEVDQDPYSYTSRLTRWTEENTSWLHPKVKEVAKLALLTHDTKAYKLLNQATVMSDFTSRYVLYEHLTQRPVEPLAKEEAIRQARDAFVNYDTPTHMSLQYLNDMGLLWFTKYYLRIQKVIIDLVRDNPLRALTLLAVDNFITNVSDILDSSFLAKSPVNLGAGALELPESIGEIITVQGAAAPF
jgi:hypothetical protein